MASASSPNSSPSAIPPTTSVTSPRPFNTTPPPISNATPPQASNATSPFFPPVTLSPSPSNASDPSSAPPPLTLRTPSPPSPPSSPPPPPQVTSSPPPLPLVAKPPSSPEFPLPLTPPPTFPPPPTLLQRPPPAFPAPLPPENSPPSAASSPPPSLLQLSPPQVPLKPPVAALSPPHSTSSSPPPLTVESPPSPSSQNSPEPPTSPPTPPFISQTAPPSPNPLPRQMLSPPPISTAPPPKPVQNDSSTSRSSSTSPSATFPLDTPDTLGPDIASDSTGTSRDGISSGAVAGISIVAGVLMVSLIFLALWFVRKRKKGNARSRVGYTEHSLFGASPGSDTSFIRPHHSNAVVRSGSGMGNSTFFTYEELLQATKGFSTDNLLGEGGFGRVYKGCLSDGREVAIKQLKMGGGQGEREFRAEVEIITRVHHRHLVSLVGYCISDHQRLLVYDFVPNNTLHHHLHGNMIFKGQSRQSMDWETRVKVAAGAARGIAYLHEDCHPRIIHRDIKSSNILLDHNFDARVSDFGLAKLALDAHTHVTTRVMGTFGYMAPEYASSGKLTEKSDVFSFGVVLLELITGRKPVDTSQPLGDESLVEWARPLLTKTLELEEFSDLIDPIIKMNFVKDEMRRMIEVSAACIRHYASKRPRMSQVVRALDAIHELPDLNNGLAPGQSVLVDSSQQSAQIRMFQRMAFGSREYNSDFDDMSGSGWSGNR